MEKTTPLPGERLQFLLKYLRITQLTFAEKIGTNPKFISQMVTGKKPITAKTAYRIQNIYGINPDWLLRAQGEMLIRSSHQKSAHSSQVNEPAADYTSANRISFDDVPDLLHQLFIRVEKLESEMRLLKKHCEKK